MSRPVILGCEVNQVDCLCQGRVTHFEYLYKTPKLVNELQSCVLILILKETYPLTRYVPIEPTVQPGFDFPSGGIWLR